MLGLVPWTEFSSDEPELAAHGERLLSESHGYAFLATVAANGAPRVHPVAPIFAGDGVYVAVASSSPKLGDLRRDPRIALHSAVIAPHDEEFSLRGIVHELTDPAARAEVAASMRAGAELVDHMVLFDIDIDSVGWAVWSDGTPQRRRWRRQGQPSQEH